MGVLIKIILYISKYVRNFANDKKGIDMKIKDIGCSWIIATSKLFT